MTKRRLKRSTIYILYGLALCILFSLFYLIDGFTFKSYNNDDYIYVDETVIEDIVPVVNTTQAVLRPYVGDDIKIIKDYYDAKASEEEQKNSIIFYENTYMPSTSILYSADEDFDVVSILDGEVTSVLNDTILGTVVQVKHNNNIISIYQSVSDVKVKEGDKIIAGSVIAKSGKCNLSKETEHGLYFEMIVNGLNVDPENYYDKQIDEI